MGDHLFNVHSLSTVSFDKVRLFWRTLDRLTLMGVHSLSSTILGLFFNLPSQCLVYDLLVMFVFPQSLQTIMSVNTRRDIMGLVDQSHNI